ncbi:MAG: endonuclease/exonuclease/phosphatase family protein [Proteobacteria bacterium]|nr:endonuclease/exonuclease/phosphatase family protein [Pseudomonadota bacterium]
MVKRLHQSALLCLLVLGGLALASCTTTDYVRKGPLPPPISAKSPLTVMSFNIRMGLGQKDPHRDTLRMKDQWGRNLDAVIEAIRSADPDIVGLQEVAGPGQLRDIAQALDMNHAFVGHDTGNDLPPLWGVGVLSKYPITSLTRAALSENRNFIKTTVDVGTRKISVVNIHRSHLEFSEVSMPILMGELAQIQLPIVLIGDFNILPEAKMRKNPGKKQLQPILDKFLDTAVEARTKAAADVLLVGTGQDGGRIDYVFAEKDKFSVLDAGLVAGKHRDASKHVAYFAKVIFKE